MALTHSSSLVGFGRALLAALSLAVAGTGLQAAGTRYYVNDHLATTVGIADAAGEIAALEADAFGSPLAAGEAPSRYTGKPYDEDMGAFVFPFRNYRAKEGRWMTADPSGFPDGVNSFSYAGNLWNVDPLGLYTETVTGTAYFYRSTEFRGGFINYTAVYAGLNSAGKPEERSIVRNGTFLLNGLSSDSRADAIEATQSNPWAFPFHNVRNSASPVQWIQQGSATDGAISGNTYSAPAARSGWVFDGWTSVPNFAASSFFAVGSPSENIIRNIGTTDPLKYINQRMEYAWSAIANYKKVE